MSDTYKVVIEPHAWAAIMSLSEKMQDRVLLAIESLEIVPRPGRAEMLEGADRLYKLRVGDFRIIYDIQDKILLVLIVDVGNRKNVYKRR